MIGRHFAAVTCFVSIFIASGLYAAQHNPFYIVSSDVIGRQVRDGNAYGEVLGTLSGIIIDSSTGEALYAIIDRGRGFLGWDEYKVVVPFNLMKFTGQWNNPMLAMTAVKLDNAPRFSDQDIEALLQDEDWRRSVAQYFGVALAEPGKESTTVPAPPAGEAPSPPAAPSAANAAVETGKTIAQSMCGACHTFDKGGSRRVGPNLYGIAGEQIADVPGFNFSSALKAHKGVWTEQNLNDWLKNPNAFAPGTYMTFPGVPSDSQRQDVIAYLESLKDNTGRNQAKPSGPQTGTGGGQK
jgi:cytochrome c